VSKLRHGSTWNNTGVRVEPSASPRERPGRRPWRPGRCVAWGGWSICSGSPSGSPFGLVCAGLAAVRGGGPARRPGRAPALRARLAWALCAPDAPAVRGRGYRNAAPLRPPSVVSLAAGGGSRSGHPWPSLQERGRPPPSLAPVAPAPTCPASLRRSNAAPCGSLRRRDAARVLSLYRGPRPAQGAGRPSLRSAARLEAAPYAPVGDPPRCWSIGPRGWRAGLPSEGLAVSARFFLRSLAWRWSGLRSPRPPWVLRRLGRLGLWLSECPSPCPRLRRWCWVASLGAALGFGLLAVFLVGAVLGWGPPLAAVVVWASWAGRSSVSLQR